MRDVCAFQLCASSGTMRERNQIESHGQEALNGSRRAGGRYRESRRNTEERG